MTNEELMAYVDGELDAPDAARVEASIAVDPALAARVKEQRELRAQLQRAFGPVLEEPVPARLSALAGTQISAVASLDAARERREEKLRPRWSWRELSAVAATLVLGVLLGPYVMRSSQPLPFMSEGGRVVAIGTLQTALMSQLSGATSPEPDGPTIG
ncbi:MAG: anti-sigma factor, partial [Pseudomonadota bacterium]